MQYIFGTLIFLFGSALGSFVLVVAERFNTGLPFLKGRSICFSCNTNLQKKDLVPLFSFLFLRGKCRHCGSKIPKEALIVEILMGILAVLAFLKTASFLDFILITAIFGNVLLISVYDLKHFIIPDSFLISLFIPSLLYFPIIHNSYFIIQNFLSGIILALPFLLIFLISKGRWIGLGDVKYIAVLGFFLGFIQGLSAIVLAFWIGAAFSLLALSFKKIAPHINLPLLGKSPTIKSEVPFGPFLSLGIITSFYLNLDLFQIHELFNLL